MTSSKKWIRPSFLAALWLAACLVLSISVALLGQLVGIDSIWPAFIGVLGIIALARYSSIKAATITISIVCITAIVGYAIQSPSNDRQWAPEVSRLPKIHIDENMLKVENLRDFIWESEDTFEERWTKTSYDLNELSGIEAIVVPFDESDLAAHVMLSFVFENERNLLVSVEARREIGEEYSLLAGASRQFELIYLFGTEQDLLDLRILHRGDRVYSLPIKADKRFSRELLLELSQSANQLIKTPRFYATLRDNCTTTLLRHVNRLREEPIGFSREILFPGRLGELLHRLNYLDTDLDWPDAKKSFRIDERIRNPRGEARL